MNSTQPITMLILKCTVCCSQEFHLILGTCYHTISPDTPPCTVPFSSLKLSGGNQTRVRMWQISLSSLIFKHFHPLWLSSHLTSPDSSLIISWVPGLCGSLSLILSYSSLLNVFLLFLRSHMLRLWWSPCWWPTLAAHFLFLTSAQLPGLAQNFPQG